MQIQVQISEYPQYVFLIQSYTRLKLCDMASQVWILNVFCGKSHESNQNFENRAVISTRKH